MALTDTAIGNIKPSEKPIKLTDERGLYLLLKPNGSRWWRFDYRYGGKRKTLSMGVYPDVSLKEARNRWDEGRKLLASDADPGEKRRAGETDQFTFLTGVTRVPPHLGPQLPLDQVCSRGREPPKDLRSLLRCSGSLDPACFCANGEAPCEWAVCQYVAFRLQLLDLAAQPNQLLLLGCAQASLARKGLTRITSDSACLILDGLCGNLKFSGKLGWRSASMN